MPTTLWIPKSARGGHFNQNDEDARRKFENYPLMEATNPGVVRAILEPCININISQGKSLELTSQTTTS